VTGLRKGDPAAAPDALLTSLEALRRELGTVSLPLQVPDVDAARAALTSLRDQLDDYLLPRLRQLDAPLLAVVGGSTGAGKSTLVNSLVGSEVTRAGVLRPTTRSPVLVHHPDDAEAFTSDRVLPSLAKTTGRVDDESPAGRITSVRLVASDTLPAGLALLDAPDIDSVVEANRELATQLLAAADLWLFVTTAARYADAVPWDLLRTSVDRGTAVAVVLDRVPADALAEVRTDLATMLRDNSLAGAPLFTVGETAPTDGLLPDAEIAPLRRWLTTLASDSRARQLVVRRTLGGALDSLRARVPATADAAQAQVDGALALRTELDAAYTDADRQLEKGLTDGSLLRGEVLARWQEFVGTGEFFRGLESAIGRLRDRIAAVIRGRPAPAEPLGQALQSGVAALVRAQAEAAAEGAVLRWRSHPAGRVLLEGRPDAGQLPADFDDRLERMVRDWQRHVFDLVREEGQGRRTQARVLSFGVNGLGVVLMLVVFAGTAGLTGGEVAIAGGSAVLAQRLLEAIFGDQAVRSLATKARRDLLRRVDDLLGEEKARLGALLDDLRLDDGVPARLRKASDGVQGAR